MSLTRSLKIYKTIYHSSTDFFVMEHQTLK